jgi:hypothetical protein
MLKKFKLKIKPADSKIATWVFNYISTNTKQRKKNQNVQKH